MSDTSQGPGWWQASDGKWYPPEQAPGYTAPAPGGPAGGPPAGGGAPVPGGAAPAFDLGAAFTWTWAKFQENMQPLLILGAVVAGIPFLVNLITLFTNSLVIDLVMLLLVIILGFILPLLLTQAVLKIARGETIDTGQMFALEGNIGGYVLGAILFGILAFFGLFLCCIGYVLVWLIFGLWNFVLVDRGVGPVEALSASKDLTMGPGLGATFLPMLVYMLIASLGTGVGYGFAFGTLIGVFTLPFAYLLGAYIYKTFSGQPVAA